MAFERSIEIDATPQRIWEVMCDVERWPEWTESILELTILDGRPFGHGTSVRIRQPKFPAAKWTVTEFEPGHGFVWTSRGPGILVSARHDILPGAGGCRVDLSLEYSGALGGIFARLTRGITERYLGYEANGLKRRSEGNE